MIGLQKARSASFEVALFAFALKGNAVKDFLRSKYAICGGRVDMVQKTKTR
jgi:hypothetical protein